MRLPRASRAERNANAPEESVVSDRSWLDPHHLARRMDDVFGESDLFEQHDAGVGEIQFPPFVTVGGTARSCVMIVMPPFAVVGKADNPVVAAAVGDFVVAIAPEMRHRIDGPSDMPDV